jgi:hypothetical protein
MTKLRTSDVLILLIAIFLALLVANSTNSGDRNDLISYANHYNCLSDAYLSVSNCSGMIGNPFDFIYQGLAFIFKYLGGEGSFKYFIFFISFFIFYSISVVVDRYSKVYFLPVMFLLVDFRFWEYGFNTIRHGLSLAIFMHVFNYQLKREEFKVLSVVRAIPLFAHVSSFFYSFTSVKKFSVFFIFLSFSSCFLISFYFYESFLNLLSGYMPLRIIDKLNFYLNLNSESGYAIPLHYGVILLFSAVSIVFGPEVDRVYVYSFNISWFIFLASILIYPLGVSYRVLSYMLPFIAILFGYQVNYFIHFFKQREIKLIFLLLFFIILGVILFKNFEFILRGV